MAAPEDVNESARAFLREYPDAEAALTALFDRDDGSWTFDDVDLDSGRFGELVSREFVEQTSDGGYRLRHPDAVRAALNGEPVTPTDDREGGLRRMWADTTYSPREIGGLVSALVLVAAARLLAFPSVFRDGRVVSPGNDPYYYRYWQGQLLERSNGVTDLGVLADMGGASSRPLTHALNWWLAELLGGTASAAATVAAFLPIVAAIALGVVLYLLARLLSGDVRVGLAAVAFLAVAPVHVVYTNVGFLEHRLHQYFWLGVLALSVTWLAVDLQRRRDTDAATAARAHATARASWAVAGVLAVAVAASAHIWTGSPLTFLPLALYIALRVVVDLRADVSPAMANLPLVAGVGVGSGLATALHVGLGWHEVLAVVAPVSVAIGAVAVVALAEGFDRLDRSPTWLLGAELALGLAGLFVLMVVQPIDLAGVQSQIEALFFREGATETTSLFASRHAFVLGPLWQIGVSFYFGLAALAVATLVVARRYEPGWLLGVCFAWYYLLLAVFQVRFAAQLSFFVALFAGVGCVYLLAQVELARQFTPFTRAVRSTIRQFNIPRGRTAGYLVGTVCVLLVFNFIFVPSLVGQTTYSDDQFDAALAIDEHTETAERTYPETAVETRWSETRMYNYFVNGESSSYDRSYDAFIKADAPNEAHTILRQGDNYVVINQQSESPGPTYDALFDGLGVGYNDTEPTGRYQPVYVSDEVRAFTVVEGAVLNVTGANGEEIVATTDVEVGGETVSYERRGVIEDGSVTLRLAHPGEYTVGGQTVTVSTASVYDGERMTIDS